MGRCGNLGVWGNRSDEIRNDAGGLILRRYSSEINNQILKERFDG